MSAAVIPLRAPAPDRILRLKEVIERVGLSTATIYRRMAAGLFPRGVRLGGSRTVGWRESEINAWIAALDQSGAA